MVPPSSRGLITPLEPDRAGRRIVASNPAGPTHAAFANALRRLDVAVASICGSHHGVNEDAHSRLDGSGRFFVVADGVGGGAMAQVASRLLVAELHAGLEGRQLDAERVDQAMLAADRTIAAAIARVTERPGAATVVLCAPLDVFAAKWLVASVGDCRAYRWSPRLEPALEQLTRDDTFANLGEAPPAGGSADDPARMVGNGAIAGANAATHSLGVGEVIALCSDGAHKHLDVADWCRLLAAAEPLAARAETLAALARAHGSTDDTTVMLIERSEPAWRALSRHGRTAAGSNSGRNES
ncbi:MAG: protein phosphatase 2C domain-containing protein [Pseudomonadota bacterium]|nr:protein phosphatase 2C domain-containing protein [Pseudomonadota bacterium]